MLSKKLQIQFLICMLLVVACLLMIRFSNDIFFAEISKAVALFGSLYMFRIISHPTDLIKK